MAALPQAALPSAADIIQALESTHYRPDTALRQALAHCDEIAPLVIDITKKADNRVHLLPRQENLLFWGVHIVAAARCTSLCQPLLQFVRRDRSRYFDRLLGDAATETLPPILISVFDGDTDALLDACADRTVDGFIRWGLMKALARLSFDGAVARATTMDFLDRFEREALAEPGDAAWQGWEDAITLLGLEEMRERVRGAYRDERIVEGFGDLDFAEKQLTLARSLEPGDAGLFVREGLGPIDDPVAPLSWVKTEKEGARTRKRSQDDDRSMSGDPAVDIALDARDISWLDGFLESKHVPVGTLALESMEQIDGFFCALLVGPGDASLNDYMDCIWSETGNPEVGPEYDSEEQADYVAALLTRHWQSISMRLNGRYLHAPVLTPPSFVEPKGRYWAGGFLRGAASWPAGWGDNAPGYVTSFLNALVAVGIDRRKFPKEAATPEFRAQFIEALPKALVHMHCLWRGHPSPYRLDEPSIERRPTGPRIGRKIGRNEPCPCGSGKKYKRCCGSADKQAIN